MLKETKTLRPADLKTEEPLPPQLRPYANMWKDAKSVTAEEITDAWKEKD